MIFLILDTPPNEGLTPETRAETLHAAVAGNLVTILKRDTASDPATIGRRIKAITSEPPAKLFRDFKSGTIEQFPSLAKTGDRVIVLKSDTWEQHLVS